MKVFPNIVVCLGHKLNVDQSPPPSLLERIAEVSNVLNALPADSDRACLFTGGDPNRLGISEGQAMKLAFEKHASTSAVPTILCETASRNTVENALYCAEILKDTGCKAIYLVSSDYHMPRSRLIFKSVFDQNGIDIIPCPSYTQNRSGCLRSGADLPNDVNFWNLRERLDFELRVVPRINDMIGRYNLGPLDNADIDAARVQLCTMYSALP